MVSFLFSLSAECVSESSLLLNRRFDGVFSEVDEQLRLLIRKFVSELPENAQESPIYPKLEAFLLSIS